MKILITGALGYIGNEVLKRIIPKDNIEVIALDNSSSSAERFLPLWLGNHNFSYRHQDVSEIHPFNVDLIVNLAAKVGYIECDEDPEATKKTNIGGAEAIARFAKPTLHFSTGSVYGNLNEPCTESSKCNPETLYSKTKLESEEIIRKVPGHCIVRPATAYGISYKTRHNLLLHTLIKLASQKNEVKLFQPDAVRTFYHVEKIADFVSNWVDNFSHYEGQTLNLGHANCTITKREAVDMIYECCDSKFKVEIVEGVDPDQRNYQVDYSNLELLWDDNYDDIKSNIKKIIQYYKGWK